MEIPFMTGFRKSLLSKKKANTLSNEQIYTVENKGKDLYKTFVDDVLLNKTVQICDIIRKTENIVLAG